MSSVFQSKKWVGIFLALVVLIIILTFSNRQSWWCFIDVFFFFMAAFLQFMSLIFVKSGLKAAAKLQIIAFVCAILGVLALIGEAIAMYFIFS